VYLTPELQGLLAGQVERGEALQRKLGRIVPQLFPRPRERRAGQVRRGFSKRWCAERRVSPGRLLHDFRLTAVRNLERAGVPRSVPIKITRHRPRACIAATPSSAMRNSETRRSS
jgi:hypothetical protein